MLNLALPNGSLENETLKLFSKAGIRITRTHRRYKAEVKDERINNLVFMRPQHIPKLVGNGNYDVGITGYDLFLEANSKAKLLAKLNYRTKGKGSWRIVLLAKRDSKVKNISGIKDNTVIFSEYPNITKEAFKVAKKKVRVLFSYGSTEAHIPKDYNYGVCAAVTNTTIKANNLKIIKVLTTATAVLIANTIALKDPLKRSAIKKLIKKLS